MARIAGVDLPKDKRVEIGLRYIFGIGPFIAKQILDKTGVSPDTRVNQLSDEDVAKLRAVIENDYAVEGTLRSEISMNIDNAVILGKKEKDSGNEIRRFGEEMLFQTVKETNTDAILASGVKQIITADPHAYNALKNDYPGLPPVEHISQFIARNVKSGAIRLTGANGDGKIYTYHDPCYLGRHNNVYEDPRTALDAIGGLKRVEMERCRDRSFCCGGGGLMLFYEPEEEQRMGVVRVEMAAKAGANVIVTACPFCLVNMEDAIKVAGMEGKMEAMDLSELIAQHIE